MSTVDIYVFLMRYLDGTYIVMPYKHLLSTPSLVGTLVEDIVSLHL